MQVILPEGQVARQANLASRANVSAHIPAHQDKRMPARQNSRPAPVTLRQWRLHRGLTLDDVATQVGVGPQAVHKWEAGKTPVTLEALKLLAGVYQTTPDALLFPPAQAELVEAMRRAHAVLAGMEPERISHWLSVGEAMIPPEKKN